MKNLLLTLILVVLFCILGYSILLCVDKEAELNCIKNLNPEEDISVCQCK